MRIEIEGPHFTAENSVDGDTSYEYISLIADAGTFGEALAIYCEKFGVEISPYDGSSASHPIPESEIPKYFWYRLPNGDREDVFDIHILRADDLICPKQELDFQLMDDDVILIGVPVVC